MNYNQWQPGDRVAMDAPHGGRITGTVDHASPSTSIVRVNWDLDRTANALVNEWQLRQDDPHEAQRDAVVNAACEKHIKMVARDDAFSAWVAAKCSHDSGEAAAAWAAYEQTWAAWIAACETWKGKATALEAAMRSA